LDLETTMMYCTVQYVRDDASSREANAMSAPTLQSGIDRAGSAVSLLWKPGSAPWMPEIVEREYAGWRDEQTAWHPARFIVTTELGPSTYTGYAVVVRHYLKP
jgi:hypothetical protein